MFEIVRLVGSGVKAKLATAGVGTFVTGIRYRVLRHRTRSAPAHCPELEPLLEHDNYKLS
jgi:hypothetical protein